MILLDLGNQITEENFNKSTFYLKGLIFFIVKNAQSQYEI